MDGEIFGYIKIGLEILGLLVTLGSVIAALTPSPKDDEIMSFIKKLIDRFSISPLGVVANRFRSNGK